MDRTPRDTIITHTNINYNRDKPLKQPEYIDTYMYGSNEKRRFNTKLHNTFLVGEYIVAVWIIDIFICNVDEED